MAFMWREFSDWNHLPQPSPHLQPQPQPQPRAMNPFMGSFELEKWVVGCWVFCVLCFCVLGLEFLLAGLALLGWDWPMALGRQKKYKNTEIQKYVGSHLGSVSSLVACPLAPFFADTR